MSALELILLSFDFMASSFLLYLWAAIKEDRLYAKRLIRALLIASVGVGYLTFIVAIIVAGRS